MSSNAKTLSFISASGGVGKTTLSILLAKWIISYKGQRRAPLKLLLVDLDPTAGLSLSIMREDEYQRYVDEGKSLVGIYRMFNKGVVSVNIEDFAVSVNHEGYLLDVLVPRDDLDLIVDELWRPGNPGPRFRKILERSGIYNMYDYI